MTIAASRRTLVACDFSGPIWFFNPWSFALLNFCYHIVGWLIGRLILTGLLQPATVEKAPM